MKVWKDYKNPKITADFMKIALSSYFRFKNQYKMVCTEFLLKDVIAYDMKDKFVEVEVKISMVDFHKDKQKPKHKKYLSTRTKKDKQPTLFYYAFPAEMYKEYKEEIIKQIDEINPKYSIISVGKNNRYGHPNKEVIDNLIDSKIYRTDQDGSIMFKIKNNKLKIETCSP